MIGRVWLLAGAGCLGLHAPSRAQQAEAGLAPRASVQPDAGPPVILPAGSPIAVALTEDISSRTAKVGDRFAFVLIDDIVGPSGTAIAKGATGYGEITFSASRGAFGRVGMLGLVVRELVANSRRIRLDGRYREEGRSHEGAVAATAFAAGALGAAFVKGGECVIPRGRVLKARLGEDLVLRTPPSGAPVKVEVVRAAPPIQILN